MIRKSNSRLTNRRNYSLVSLFTGAGGLDYGFEAAGFSTCLALEMDRDCRETLRKNRLWPLISEDIHQVSSERILHTSGLRKGEVDVLAGGPPCQPFSKSSYWATGDARRLGDPRANTLCAYMRCVRDLLPRVFVLENVHGISYTGKEEGLLLIARLTEGINRSEKVQYSLTSKVVNMAHYGVPQIRQRFFLVGCRDGHRFAFPPETHVVASETDQFPMVAPIGHPATTAWDAIGHLEREKTDEDLRVKGKWADLLPSIPEGENYLWHTNRKGGEPLFGWRTRYWSFLLKLAKNRPAWTIQAQPGPAIGPFHWKNRLLSSREMCRLQTFPEDVTLSGARSAIQRQLGNAVPSLFAELLGRAIRSQVFGDPVVGAPRLLVRHQSDTPPPEPLRPVPPEFLSLVGEHAEHPGTGKGVRARSRIRTRDCGLFFGR
ncbi:MAG: DNA cytosine methyltransferase [Planctomycetes bacterium]|nr:DNA cytosine methyltransferase [Planctomycetota bacterium]